MIVPLESVRLKDPIDTHDQRNGLVLDAEHGWELALDDAGRFILARWRRPGATEGPYWTGEFPVEHARHWRRHIAPSEVEDTGLDAQPKGRKRSKG